MSEGKRGSTALAVKVGAWYVVSTFLLRSIAFVTTPIFARLMSTSDYGEFSNYANWQAILIVLLGMELFNTASRAYYDFTDSYDEYISSITLLGCLTVAIAYVCFLIFKAQFLVIIAIPEQYIHIMFITIMCSSCKTVFLTRERTLYKYKTVAAVSAIDVVIPTILSVLLVYFCNDSARLSARIYGYYVPSAIVGFVCAILMIKKGKATFKLQHCKYAIILAMPLLVHFFTASLLTATNVVIAKSVIGVELAALVSITTSAIHILTMFFQSISGAVTTWLMDNLEQNRIEKLRKEMTVYLGILSIVSIGIILLAPEVILVLGGSKYADATLLIPGFVLGTFIQSLTTIFTIILTYDKNVNGVAIATGIVSAISVYAKVVLLPHFGPQTLPYVNVAAFLTLFIISYWLVCRAGYKEVIRISHYLISILIMALFTGASYYLYDIIVIRYSITACVIAVAFAVMFKNRELLKRFIPRKKKKDN